MVYAARRFTAANPGHVAAFIAAQGEANALIATSPAEATRLFIQNSGSKIDPAEIAAVLTDPQTRFDTLPHGFMRYVAFMQRAGTIRATPKNWHEAFVPELTGEGS